METTRAERIRLGIFLLICIVGILGFVGYLIGERISNQKTRYYAVFTESVQGLSKDARVMLNGIDVGHVRYILIDPNNLENVIVCFEVKKGTPIKSGTEVQMTSGISLTGNRYLILSGGDAAEENLPEDSYVQTGVNRITEITGQAENLVARIELLLDNLNKILSDENSDRITRTLTNIEDASLNSKKMMVAGDQLIRSMKGPMADLDTTMRSLRAISTEVSNAHLADEMKKTLDEIQTKMAELDTKQMNEEMVKTLHAVQAISSRLDVFLYKNQANLNYALKQLNNILDNVNDFSQKIKSQPSSLIRSSKGSERER